MARSKCLADNILSDKMAGTKEYGQNGTDKLVRTKCYATNV